MAYKLPTKRQRQVMAQHAAAPGILTQTEVIKKLRLKDRNDFYRVFYRAFIANKEEALTE